VNELALTFVSSDWFPRLPTTVYFSGVGLSFAGNGDARTTGGI
jgi:hypothetical protein